MSPGDKERSKTRSGRKAASKSQRPERPINAPPSPSEGEPLERRQLTVLFCDLIGSTAMSTSLDPEDEGEVLREYHRCCADRITKAGGFVAQFQGDGVIAYFGYHQASESDPERAIRAALDLVESIPKIATSPGITLRSRVGVATGLAMVGDPERIGTRLEQAVVGDTINLAARLEAAASANEIIIADSTKRLIGSLFVCRNHGKLPLKGFAEPVQTWQVLRPRTPISHFRTYREPVLTRIFGREAEVDALLHHWQRTLAGDGQIVSIIGDAGIGKSRLIREFHHRIRRQSHTWLEGGGAQFFQHTPFYSISQMLLRALDPRGRASPAELRTRLARALEDAGMDLAQTAPVIGEMLGLPADKSFAPLMLAPGERRDRLFAVLADWFYATAQRQALVIVIEDLHWVDPSSLEFIERIAKSAKPLPALVLLSMRAGFRTPLPDHRNANRIRLNRLPDSKLREIVGKVGLDRSSLPPDLIERVVKRADGVPLFAVELTRLMKEQRAPSSDRRVPASLSDLLTARLDQLGPSKNVAQVAAVIGDEVSLALLKDVSGTPDGTLRSDLTKLIKTGVLQRSGSPADPIYSFKHSLLRDAAYEALLKSRRREIHRRTAVLLSERFDTLVATRPEFLAHHWAQAGEAQLAVVAWQKAGDNSSTRRAFREAQQAYQSALSLLQSMPVSADRDALETTLQGSLAEVLRITKGYSALQTIEATARARVLSERSGDIAQQFAQAVGAWAAASSSGDYSTGRDLADQILKLARAHRSEVSLAHAHMIQMTSRYRIGDLAGAEDYFERGKELFESPGFKRQPGWAAQTYGNAARNAWIMGSDTSAEERIDQALRIARENDSPYDLVFAQYMAAIHAVLTGNFADAARFADASIQLSDEHGFPQFAAISRIALGRAKAGFAALSDGLDLIRAGVDGMAKTGSRVAITLYLTWLAEAELLAGHIDESLRTIDRALEINPQELFFRPAGLQLRGDLYARKGLLEAAERDLREALRLSSRMGAKRFYDRAEESLNRLLSHERRPAQSY